MKVKRILPTVINNLSFCKCILLNATLINDRQLWFGKDNFEVLPANIILLLYVFLQRLEEIMKRTRRVEAVDKVSAANLTYVNIGHISILPSSAILNLQSCASFVETQ